MSTVPGRFVTKIFDGFGVKAPLCPVAVSTPPVLQYCAEAAVTFETVVASSRRWSTVPVLGL